MLESCTALSIGKITVQQISASESNSVIHWMEIYSMDSINIHLFKTLNQTCVNWGGERRQT